MLVCKSKGRDRDVRGVTMSVSVRSSCEIVDEVGGGPRSADDGDEGAMLSKS